MASSRPQQGLFDRRNRGNQVERKGRNIEQLLESDRAVYSCCPFKINRIVFGSCATSERNIPTRCSTCYDKSFTKAAHYRFNAHGIRNSLNHCDSDVPPSKSFANTLVTPFHALRKLQEEKNKNDWKNYFHSKVTNWITYLMLKSTFKAICVHDGQLHLLKEFPQIHPVVFLPLDRSYLDHFVLSWATLQYSEEIPVALGDWKVLQDPLLAKLLKDWNIYDKDETAEDLTLKLLKGYNTNAKIRAELPLQYMNASGKITPGQAPTAVFETAIEKVASGQLGDTIFIPVNVTYEKSPTHEPGTTSVWSRLWKMWKTQGSIVARINFAHPISVRELIVSLQTDLVLRKQLRTDDEGNEFPLSDDEDEVEETLTTDRNVLQKAVWVLNNHSLYDAQQCGSILSTHLVAFALLQLHRNAWVDIQELQEDIRFFIQLLRTSDNDIGFSSRSDLGVVVRRGIEVLGEELVEVSEGGTQVRHNNTVEAMIKLNSASNHVLSLLAMKAVVITSIYSGCRTSFELYTDVDVDVEVCEKDVITASTNLAKFLQSEFILHAPCITLKEAIQNTLHWIQTAFMITIRITAAKTFGFSRYDEDDLVDNTNDQKPANYVVTAASEKEMAKRFRQLAGLMVPYLQAYDILVETVSMMLLNEENSENLSKEVSEAVIVKIMMANLKRESNHAVRPELATYETVDNFLKTFLRLGVLSERFEEPDLFYYSLTDMFRSREKMEIIRDHLMFYT